MNTFSPRVGALDVFVSLLSEVDAPTAPGRFYSRICEAVSRLTAMERVVLFRYDETLHRVRAEGSFGVDPILASEAHGTLEETPVARRALAEDRVVEISERIEEELPSGYARFLPITTLTCTPLSAGGRWFGVILADRGGVPFSLTEEERHVMWTLGKLTALAASAQIATRQQEQARELNDRIDLARDIHERVVQRLFGLSLVLRAEHELSGEERARASDELAEALTELRSALSRPLAPRTRVTRSTLGEELDRLRQRYPDLPISVSWPEDRGLPAELEPLAQSVLAEALRNAHRHAAPERVEVTVDAGPEALVLAVENDGVRDGRRGAGMGLRLSAFEALQQGGVLEFGAPRPGQWRVRLVVPRSDT